MPTSSPSDQGGKATSREGAGDEPTAVLLKRARSGSALEREGAREGLMERFLPRLKSWARGRLPSGARTRAETDDLVQVTLLRALERIDAFENRGEGAFLAYLRQILLNAVREEIRHAGRRPGHQILPEDELPRHPGPSAVESAIGREAMAAYEASLAELDERQREAVLLRVEFGYAYAEIAEAMGITSANAARMVVSRALAAIARSMESPP